GFYFTHQQRKRLETLLNSLAVKKGCSRWEVLENSWLEEVRGQAERGKERTKLLLAMLQSKLSPFTKRFEDKLGELCFSVKMSKGEVVFTPHYEDSRMRFNYLVEKE